jgi:hypothetical protein
MARRKHSNAPLGAVVIFAAIGLIASVPAGYWFALAFIAVVAWLLWKVARVNSQPRWQSDSSDNAKEQGTVTVSENLGQGMRLVALSDEETTGKSKSRSSKSGGADTRWIPPGQTATFRGRTLPGGMLYIGATLTAANRQSEPAQLDPSLGVGAQPVDLSERLTSYWPSYDSISPDARRAYLDWLSGGRSDPNANIGYVFLFFYGIERRVIVDRPKDSAVDAEMPALLAEVRRLLGIYRSNGSFNNYANGFLGFAEMLSLDPQAPIGQPPAMGAGLELPFSLRLALGRMAVAGLPVPAEWAHAWSLADPAIRRPTAVIRCDEAYRKLFLSLYATKFGAGLVLQPNRTKLKIAYRPASGGLRGVDCNVDTGLPDIAAVVAPGKKIAAIVEECAKRLDAYSRYLGRHPGQDASLDATLLLPTPLWPDSVRNIFASLSARMGEGLVLMTLSELLTALKHQGPVTKDRLRSLAHALDSLQIGLEPDVANGAKTPRPDDQIVLFHCEIGEGIAPPSASYKAAALTIDFGASVAAADGTVAAPELQLILAQIKGWSDLTEGQRKRLRARLRLTLASPPSMPSLKKQLDGLTAESKRALSHVLAALALADGIVAPEEVRLLEKIYGMLGIDVQTLYSDLHMEAAGSMASTPAVSTSTAGRAPESKPVVELDAARIAQLQEETARVSALLSKVFSEEAPIEEPADAAPQEVEASSDQAEPMGLDADHAAFFRLLISRPSWSRAELADAASDMGLMLNGALERINEAAFDHYDEPLLEGEDPVEVAQNLIQEQTA